MCAWEAFFVLDTINMLLSVAFLPLQKKIAIQTHFFFFSIKKVVFTINLSIFIITGCEMFLKFKLKKKKKRNFAVYTLEETVNILHIIYQVMCVCYLYINMEAFA